MSVTSEYVRQIKKELVLKTSLLDGQNTKNKTPISYDEIGVLALRVINKIRLNSVNLLPDTNHINRNNRW